MALPMSFKLKNIESTEKAAKVIHMHSNMLLHQQNSSTLYQRFQIDHHATVNSLPHGVPLEHAMPTNDVNENQKRPLKSTDDMVANRYKKVRCSFYIIANFAKFYC